MKRYVPHITLGSIALIILCGLFSSGPNPKVQAEEKSKESETPSVVLEQSSQPIPTTYTTDEPSVCVYPQFARAQARALGVLEVTFCEVCPHAPARRSDKAIAVATPDGTRELQLTEISHYFCARELKAYRAGGSALNHDDVLSEFRTAGVVLVTLAPATPPLQYLDALAEDVIVLELPYRPRIKIFADDLAAL